MEWLDERPILGVLGVDFLLPHGEIDYPGGRVVSGGEARMAGVSELPGLPLRIVDQRPLVKVRLDGRDLELLFDTGAHDTLWLATSPRPGDEEIAVQTADGAIHSVFAGEAVIELPGEAPRAIPVLRANEIPYLSPWLVDELGADGLLGLTALGLRRVVFDGDRLRLGPRSDGDRSPAR